MKCNRKDGRREGMQQKMKEGEAKQANECTRREKQLMTAERKIEERREGKRQENQGEVQAVGRGRIIYVCRETY